MRSSCMVILCVHLFKPVNIALQYDEENAIEYLSTHTQDIELILIFESRVQCPLRRKKNYMCSSYGTTFKNSTK